MLSFHMVIETYKLHMHTLPHFSFFAIHLGANCIFMAVKCLKKDFPFHLSCYNTNQIQTLWGGSSFELYLGILY